MKGLQKPEKDVMRNMTSLVMKTRILSSDDAETNEGTEQEKIK